MKGNKDLSKWAFWIGAILAVLLGIGSVAKLTLVTDWAQWIVAILVVLGLVVGLVNITVKETVAFLLAAIVLGIGSGVLSVLDKIIPQLGTLVVSIVQNFALLIGAAAVVVAIKEAWVLASRK